MNHWPVLLAFVATLAAAQDKPSEHPYTAPVVVDAAASHYRFAVPAATYRGAARRDLGDLRIFNAAGEPVPYAYAVRESRPAAAASIGVNLFPLHGDQDKGVEATNVTVRRTSSGTVVNVAVTNGVPAARRRLIGYILDTSEIKAPQDALVLAWDAGQGFSGQARVEGSEDLKHWRPLASNAPVLSLEHGGARLERNRVELSGVHAKYLRLSFQGVPPGFTLKQARVELRGDKPEPVRAWLSIAANEGKARGELLVDTGGHFPVDRVRLALPQPNTVAQIQLLSRERPEDKWRPAAFATVYRIAGEGGDVSNPDIAVPVNVDRYWLVKVDQKGGGFGAGEVHLELGWLPHEVVFAARGTGPFTLAYGNKAARPGAMPIAAVLPGQGEAQKTSARLATIGEASGVQPSLMRGLAQNPDAKKWLLWAALVAGVLLLAWMAFRLLRDLGNR